MVMADLAAKKAVSTKLKAKALPLSSRLQWKYNYGYLGKYIFKNNSDLDIVGSKQPSTSFAFNIGNNDVHIQKFLSK